MSAISAKITFWPCRLKIRLKCGPISVSLCSPEPISDIDIGPLIGNATVLLCQAVNKLILIINSYLIITATRKSLHYQDCGKLHYPF